MPGYASGRFVIICLLTILITFHTASASSLSHCSNLPDGAEVTFTSQTVSACWPGFFYIQQPDRAFGIKVMSPFSVQSGDVVNISGTLATIGGERCIVAGAVAVTQSGLPLPAPFIVSVRNLGGSALNHNPGVDGCEGLYNIGLFVKTWGAVSDSGADRFTLTGEGASCQVLAEGLILPEDGAIVTVKGISSVGEGGGRMLRATSISTRPKWYPSSIVYCGNSFTDGLDASAADKVYHAVTNSILAQHHPERSRTSRILFGVSGGLAVLMANAIHWDSGTPPTCFVLQNGENDGQIPLRIQDEEGNGATVNINKLWPAQYANGAIWTEADGKPSVTITNGGQGYRNGAKVLVKQGPNTAAMLQVRVEGAEWVNFPPGPEQPIGPIAEVRWGGAQGYRHVLGPAELIPFSFEGDYRRCLDEIHAKWPDAVVFVLPCYGGFLNWRNISALQKSIAEEPQYRGFVRVLNTSDTAYLPGHRGIRLDATYSSATRTWTFAQPLGFDPEGMWVTEGPYHAQILPGSSGNFAVVSGTPEHADGMFNIFVSENVGWRIPGRFGDNSHPADRGHRTLGEMLAAAILAEIEANK